MKMITAPNWTARTSQLVYVSHSYVNTRDDDGRSVKKGTVKFYLMGGGKYRNSLTYLTKEVEEAAELHRMVTSMLFNDEPLIDLDHLHKLYKAGMRAPDDIRDTEWALPGV